MHCYVEDGRARALKSGGNCREGKFDCEVDRRARSFGAGLHVLDDASLDVVDREPEDGKVELAKLMKSVEHEPHLKALVQGELRFWSQPVEPPEMGKWLSAERQFGALVAKADDPFRLVASTLRGKFSGKDLAGLALQIATEDEKQHGFMKKVSDNLCDRLPLPSIREQPSTRVVVRLRFLHIAAVLFTPQRHAILLST